MFNKEKMMKWAACVGFGIVLSVIVSLIINFAYHGKDIDSAENTIANIRIVFFIVHMIWLYLILHNPIQAKIQNIRYNCKHRNCICAGFANYISIYRWSV